MRLSNRAKKILLTLLTHPEFQKIGRSARDWWKLESTVKYLIREVDGEGSFYAYGRYSHKECTFNRTLRNLYINGFLERWKTKGNEYSYYLSYEGEEKAEKIKAEIENFIEDWRPFLIRTACYTLSPNCALPEGAHLDLNVDDDRRREVEVI